LIPLERANLNHWTTSVRFTQLFNHFGTGQIHQEVRRKYTIEIVIKHAHAWNWERKWGRNLY
jgi:hypothetical protein